jgi:hypothetical protein
MAIRETPSEPLIALTNADRMPMPVPHGSGKSSGASPRSGLLCAALLYRGHTTMPRAKMSSSQSAGNVRSAAVQFSRDFARRQWIGGGSCESSLPMKAGERTRSYRSQLAVILDNLVQSTANGSLSFLPWADVRSTHPVLWIATREPDSGLKRRKDLSAV